MSRTCSLPCRRPLHTCSKYQRAFFTATLLASSITAAIWLLQRRAYYHQLELDLAWDGQVENFSYPENVAFVVPNIVHFIRLGDTPLLFVEAVCMRAAWLQQRPEALMIHCDICNATINSPLWYLIKDIPGLSLRYIQRPKKIFGVEFSYVQHTSDVLRALVLMKYGGIYLDSDSYLVKSLDAYRQFEMAIGWPPGESAIGNQVLVAHKNARYLRLWYESYHLYRPELWYWNGGELPTKKFLSVRPELVHRVPYDFGVSEDVGVTLYGQCDNTWREFSAFHLFWRHRARLVPSDSKRYGPLTLDTIANYDRNYGQMARLVLSGTTRLGAKEIKSIDWLSENPLDYSKHGCS